MKKLMNLKLIAITFIVLVGLTGCKTNDVVADCGCDLPNEESQFVENIEGTASFAHLDEIIAIDPGTTPEYRPFNKYWITKINNSNYMNSMNWVICNDNVLPQEIINLRETMGKLNVRFSGYVKTMCDFPSKYGYNTLYNIYITKIEIEQ